VLFVLASVLFPVPIYSEADLVQVKIGWPLGFVVQDQSRYAFILKEPLGYKPPLLWQTHLYSVWENQTQILWLQFFLDIAIVFAAIILGLNLIKAISLKTRRL
jgi:hypothetical protein